MDNLYCAVFKDNGQIEIWSKVRSSEEAALLEAEANLLDAYGSKSNKYKERINRLQTVPSSALN